MYSIAESTDINRVVEIFFNMFFKKSQNLTEDIEKQNCSISAKEIKFMAKLLAKYNFWSN